MLFPMSARTRAASCNCSCSRSTNCTCPLRLAAPGRPRSPRGPAGPWGQPALRRSDVARRGGARGPFRERPRGCSGARGAGKRRPAPPEPGAAPASRAPAAHRAGGARTRHGRDDAATPRAAPRGQGAAGTPRNRRLRRVGARPGPSPQSSARNTHPARGTAEGGWTKGLWRPVPPFLSGTRGSSTAHLSGARFPQERPRLSVTGSRPQRRRGRDPARLGTAGRGRGARTDARASQPPPRAGARANGRGRGGSARAQGAAAPSLAAPAPPAPPGGRSAVSTRLREVGGSAGPARGVRGDPGGPGQSFRTARASLPAAARPRAAGLAAPGEESVRCRSFASPRRTMGCASLFPEHRRTSRNLQTKTGSGSGLGDDAARQWSCMFFQGNQTELCKLLVIETGTWSYEAERVLHLLFTASLKGTFRHSVSKHHYRKTLALWTCTIPPCPSDWPAGFHVRE